MFRVSGLVGSYRSGGVGRTDLCNGHRMPSFMTTPRSPAALLAIAGLPHPVRSERYSRHLSPELTQFVCPTGFDPVTSAFLGDRHSIGTTATAKRQDNRLVPNLDKVVQGARIPLVLSTGSIILAIADFFWDLAFPIRHSADPNNCSLAPPTH